MAAHCQCFAARTTTWKRREKSLRLGNDKFHIQRVIIIISKLIILCHRHNKKKEPSRIAEGQWNIQTNDYALTIYNISLFINHFFGPES